MGLKINGKSVWQNTFGFFLLIQSKMSGVGVGKQK